MLHCLLSCFFLLFFIPSISPCYRKTAFFSPLTVPLFSHCQHFFPLFIRPVALHVRQNRHEIPPSHRRRLFSSTVSLLFFLLSCVRDPPRVCEHESVGGPAQAWHITMSTAYTAWLAGWLADIRPYRVFTCTVCVAFAWSSRCC